MLLAALTACAAETPIPDGLPQPPATFKETAGVVQVSAATDAPAQGAWWDAFGDPCLSDVVQRATRNNWSVRLAAANLARARAFARAGAGARLPRITLNPGASRTDGALTNAAAQTGPLYVVTANLTYEADIFGRLMRESEAAQLDVAERESLLQAAVLLAQADTADTYFALRALDAERALLRRAAEAQARSVAVTQGLVQSGLQPELALAKLQTEADSIAAEALTLDRRREELEHALAVLAGETTTAFSLPPLDQSAVLPSIPAGIPAAVLVRRPDVGAARQAMLAAMKRVGVARDSWLPTLSLTASGGFASPTVGTLLAASAGATTLAGLLALPLFDPQYGARVDAANATLDAAAAVYGQQILTALRDVDDQLSGLRLLAAQAAVLDHSTTAARRTTALVASNYRTGLASQLELLDAQRTELREQLLAVRVRASRFQASVGLIRALGGGWGGRT